MIDDCSLCDVVVLIACFVDVAVFLVFKFC